VAEPAETLLRAGAARRVADARALGEAWSALLLDEAARRAMSEAAHRVMADNRGALARTTALVGALLGAP
jgi:3-deoxy-D-manno-octulosonic-acid transferase